LFRVFRLFRAAIAPELETYWPEPAKPEENDLDRRSFLTSTAGLAAGFLIVPRMVSAAEGVINWYTGSDSNVLDFWANSVKPAFEAANPGITVNLVDAGDNAGIQAIGERAMAAKQTNTGPQADFFEASDPRLPVGAIEAGIYVNFAQANMPNYSKVNPLAIDSEYSLSYRGSQVLLAFGTSKLAQADAPTTLGRAGGMDQGQSGTVHQQSPRQGRFGRQLRPPRDPSAQRS